MEMCREVEMGHIETVACSTFMYSVSLSHNYTGLVVLVSTFGLLEVHGSVGDTCIGGVDSKL